MRPAFVLALIALAVPAVALAAGLTVPVDQSRRLPVGAPAANIMVGNTDIADVRAVDSRTLMVVGKKQGVTNVVVFDQAGRTLFDGEVTVSASAGQSVTVYRGTQAAQYACSPFCQSPGGQAAQPAASAPVVTTTAPVVRSESAAPGAGAPTP